LTRIVSLIRPENGRSAAVARRLGMRIGPTYCHPADAGAIDVWELPGPTPTSTPEECQSRPCPQESRPSESGGRWPRPAPEPSAIVITRVSRLVARAATSDARGYG